MKTVEEWTQQALKDTGELVNTPYYRQWAAEIQLDALNEAHSVSKEEILNILRETEAPKVPGMEGLGGYSWDDMDAETFRGLLIKKIEKL